MSLIVLKSLLYCTIMFSNMVWSARNELVANADCVCPGELLTFKCSVVGGLFTVWRGSVTGDNCEVTLIHSEYNRDGGSRAGCINGNSVIGQSVSALNGCYVSTLSIDVTPGIDGSTVECNRDDGDASTLINSTTIRITRSPVPPPRSIHVSVNNRELNFTWLPVDYLCPSLTYSFTTSVNCGRCINLANTTTVTCSAFTVSTTPNACDFSVRSSICGNITGEAQMQGINLQVPGAPVVQTVPQYFSDRTRSLTKLTTTFAYGDQISIFDDDLDGSALNFTIIYSDATFSSVCGLISILASSCVTGTCSHTFDILESSLCPATTSLVVTAYVSNVLGRGLSSAFSVIDGINNLVNVSFSQDDQRIVCSFHNQPTNALKNCSANITYGENCDQPLGIYGTVTTGNTITTPPLEARPDVADYCFVVTATVNNVTVMVEGNLINTGFDSNSAAIAITVTIIVIGTLITIVLIGLLVYKLYQNSIKSTFDVKFSIRHEAGSLTSALARALKVFKDLRINIVGVNTHLHHAEFDRKAEKGYNFNYIDCVVSSADVAFLRENLKAKILKENAANGDKHNITAAIKVKDKPGGFLKVLEKMNERSIILTGVNTGDKHESSPGFKEIHLECSISSTAVQKLHKRLTDVGVANVKIKLLTQKRPPEKAIEYLVRDQAGALAYTLEVFTDIGLNISGVNVDHLGKDVTDDNLRWNYIECSVDDQKLKTLQATLKMDYGAINVECINDQVNVDKNHRILKVTMLNETGSLNRVLKAFSVLSINLHSVNVRDPVFPRDRTIVYKHYHVEIVATHKQFTKLTSTLYSKGLATDVHMFDISKYCDASGLPQSYQIMFALAGQQEIHENDFTPRTLMIEFFVRDEVGALAEVLQVFGEIGITISKINPAHMAAHHQSEYVECVCKRDNRDALRDKILSCGAEKAEFLPESELPASVNARVPNYCVVELSVGSAKIVDVLKAFPDSGVNVSKINPTHIKHHSQHVECCCTDDDRKELLSKLKDIKGVIHVKLLPQNEEHASKPQPDNHCVIKFSVREEAGILVEALKAFIALDINIIGVNTLKPAFERMYARIYKHNHVVFLGTDEQEEELKNRLLVTGLAIDVGSYRRGQVGAEDVHIDVETKV